MIFLLDNYDSFTFNLVQRIGEIDPAAEIRVERNDQISIEQIESLCPERIIISPGPCTPSEAGLSRELIAHFGPQNPDPWCVSWSSMPCGSIRRQSCPGRSPDARQDVHDFAHGQGRFC